MNLRHRAARYRAMGLSALMISSALGMVAPLGRVHAGAAQAEDHRIYLPALNRAPLRELRPGGSAFGRISAVAAHGDHALVGEGSHVVAYGVGPDGTPRALGRSEPLDGNVVRILWDGGEWAYVVTRAAEARLHPARAPYVASLAVSVLGSARSLPRLQTRNAVVGFADIQVHAGHAYVCGGSGFTVYNLADPTGWRALTTVSLPGGTLASGMFQCRHDGEHTFGVRGDREGNLLRYDVSDPAHPLLLAVDAIAEQLRMNMDDFSISAGQVHSIWCIRPMAGGPQCSYVPSSAVPADLAPRFNFPYAEVPTAPTLQGGMAYVRTHGGPEGAGSLTVVDPRGSGELPRRSRLRLDFPPVDLAIDADRAWLVGNRQLQVADLSDLDAPRALGRLRRPGGVAAIAAADGLVFVASADQPELHVLRGADAEPAATVTLDGWRSALAIAPGAPLVAVVGGTLALYSADAALRPLGRLNLDQGSPLGPGITVAAGETYALRVAAGRAYVVRESWTLADERQGTAMELDIIDLREPSKPELLSRTVLDRSKPQEFGGIAVAGERVFIATGDLGTVVELDLSDPRMPVQLSTQAVEGGLAGGIAAWGHRLLIAAGTAGLRVVDPADGWRELARLEGIGRVLDVVVDGGMAYGVTGEGRLIVVELRADGSIAPAGDLPLPTGGRRLALDGDRLWVDRGDGGASWFEIGGP
ncbi:MAG: hypothetical protein IPJ58_13525 [Ardenticatenia bacterium]|nr:hypothetical protein [Ardenticatenia bacterium]